MSVEFPHSGYFPSPVRIPVENTFGAEVIGTWIELVLFGIVLLQTVAYFMNFPKDSVYLKGFIAALFAVDFLAVISHCNTVWYLTVHQWGNTVAFDTAPWSYPVSFTCMALIQLGTQGYFAYRVWVLSGFRAWYMAALIALAALVSSSFGIATAAVTVEVVYPSRGLWWAWGTTTWYSVCCLTDFLITSSLVYYMTKARTGWHFMDRVLSTWIVIALETNGVSFVAALVGAALVAKNQQQTTQSLVYVGTLWGGLQLYPLSLLTVLNSRTALKPSSASQKSASSPKPTFYSQSAFSGQEATMHVGNRTGATQDSSFNAPGRGPIPMSGTMVNSYPGSAGSYHSNPKDERPFGMLNQAGAARPPTKERNSDQSYGQESVDLGFKTYGRSG